MWIFYLSLEVVMVPKIVFHKLSVEENVNYVIQFYQNEREDDFINRRDAMIRTFPALREIIRSNMTEDGIIKEIEEEVIRSYQEESFDMDRLLIDYQQYFDVSSKSFLSFLSQVLGCDWPESMKVISVYVGILPAHFGISETSSIYLCSSSMGEVFSNLIHELTHFLYFQKWRLLHRFSKPSTFLYPGTIWEYSEMVIDPILNRAAIKGLFYDIPGMHYAAESFCYDHKHSLVMFELQTLFPKENIDDAIQKGYRMFLSSK